MSLNNCILEAKKWAEENSELKLRPVEIEQLGRLLEAAHASGATPAERAKLMQDAVLSRIEMIQQANRGEAYLNAIKHTQNASNIAKNVELWGGKADSPANALEALTTGKSARPGFGVNNDPLAASRSNLTRYMNFLENSLTKQESKIFKALAPGDSLTKDIMQELDALRNKTQLGQSGSDIALSIAKKVREAQDAVFKEAQAVNPYLRESQLYLFSRSHNMELVGRVSQEEWVKDAQAAFGKNLIGEPEQIRAMLADTYKRIKSGLPPEGRDMAPRDWEPRGTGGSQALQSAGNRIFVANDWKSEFNYNAKYGDSLYNAFVKQAQYQADYVATTNKWGTRPADNFQKLFNTLLKNANDEQKVDLLHKEKGLREKFESTQGSRSNIAWSIQGKIAQGLQSAENLAMLGNHVSRTLSSGPAMLAQMRDGYGANIFDHVTSLARVIEGALKQFGDAGRRELNGLSVATMDVQREMANQIAAGEGLQIGKAAQLSRLLGKLTLADYTTNAWKFATAKSDARALGDFAGRSFGELPPITQELLRRYDIGDNRWEVIRHAVDPKSGLLVPDAIRNIPDDVVHQLTEGKQTAREAARLRGELAQNLGTFLNERASMTVAESNSASRATAYGLSDINTAQGIARRFLYQFKQASITRQQLLMRTFRSGGGNTSNISGAMQYMLGAAFAGMVGQQLVELGAGREPLDVSDPKIIGHMIRSTGIAGFYGDMLADFLTSPEPDMMKRMTEGDFLGPSFGTIEKAGQAAFRTGHGVVQYAEGKERSNQFGGAQWARLIHSLTPGQNIFYAKGGLDYTLFNEVHEFMGDQGYLGTLRAQMRRSKNLFGDTQGYTFGGENAWH